MKSQRLSNKICPDNMTVEEWQIALRRENAMDANFEVKHLDDNRIWGDYSVISDSGNYKVAFRGVRSDRNFCSCLDFRTNGLGTCKHIECVSLYLQSRVPGYPWGDISYTADYSSIYVSYRGGRSIKMRIGRLFSKEYEAIKTKYFNQDNTLPEQNYYLFDEIIDACVAISATFRVYDDVKDYIHSKLQEQRWRQDLKNTYMEELIPWNKKKTDPSISLVEKLLYQMVSTGYGLMVASKSDNIIHLVIRLAEEIYQGEEVNHTGYIIVENQYEVQQWQTIQHCYIEAIDLPIKVMTAHDFIDESSINNSIVTFMYVDNASVLKEWRNPLSLSIKKRTIKHLYMRIASFGTLSPVQLSSILQHISPFIIGPFYKFIHNYRPSFPLLDDGSNMPKELESFTSLIRNNLDTLPLQNYTDYKQPIEEIASESEERVKTFFVALQEILSDPKAIEIIKQKLSLF